MNQKFSNSNLPSFLKSRAGWGKMLESKRSHFPHLHQIEPTNACPYHCVMCPRGVKMKRGIGFLEMDLFCKVMEELEHYPIDIKKKEIELFHFGESLLHPRIAEMNDYAILKGLNTVLSVNAIELEPKIAEKLILGKARKIIVSLDGFDSESFEQIRGRKINYDLAIENILKASTFITDQQSDTKLLVRMISLKANKDQQEEFKEFWKKRNILAEIREFFPWGESEMANLGNYDKFPPFMPCPFAWQYVVIQWNGDVVACCRDYNAENVMGNVKNETLEEIWNGKKYQVFRENMVSGNYQNTICKPCMDLYYTEF